MTFTLKTAIVQSNHSQLSLVYTGTNTSLKTVLHPIIGPHIIIKTDYGILQKVMF